MTSKKIDSNVTGLRFVEETTLNTLPSSPVWSVLEPNEYNDFGGNLTTLARSPISADRSRKKGVVTDLEAAGGFQMDLTHTNMQSLLQGFMFADARKKANTTSGSTTTNAYNVTSSDGFVVGDMVVGRGFVNSGNNEIHLIMSKTNTAITVLPNLVAETTAGAEVITVGTTLGTGEVKIDVTGDLPKLVRVSGSADFTSYGLVIGEWIYIGSDADSNKFATTNNNGFKRIRSISETELVFDKSENAMAADSGAGKSIHLYFGDVIKNESGSLIKRRSYQFERTLGSSDESDTTKVQSEYLVGAVANDLEIKIASADKITTSLSFIASDHETRSGATGVKAGDRPSVEEAPAFNTSSDVSRIRLSKVSQTEEAPTALFAFVSEVTLKVSNNVTGSKAIGTLGNFDLTAGTFSVSGDIDAYFADVAALSSIRNNDDITLDIMVAAKNKGIVIDLPLLTIGESRAEVAQDEPIKLPLSSEAVAGSSAVEGMDQTLLFVFFNYLPDSAEG